MRPALAGAVGPGTTGNDSSARAEIAAVDIDYFGRLVLIAEDAKIDAVFLGAGPARSPKTS